MIALLDNYDSFTYNLVYLLRELDEEVEVFLPSNLSWKNLDKADNIILSPGPGHPKDAKLNHEIIHKFYKTKAILGVCLGHQCIGHSFGAEVSKAKKPIHGKTSKLSFKNCDLFSTLPQGIEVMRYHSLIVRNLPTDLEEIAWAEDGTLMALKHRYFQVYGVQFHPESILSQEGKRILKNFCNLKP